jgi:hypothetical protein
LGKVVHIYIQKSWDLCSESPTSRITQNRCYGERGRESILYGYSSNFNCTRPPLMCTVEIFIHTGKGAKGAELTSEKARGQCFTKPVENANKTDCISSLYTLLNVSKDDMEGFVSLYLFGQVPHLSLSLLFVELAEACLC